MNRRTRIAIALALGVVAGAATTAGAAEGRIPIAEPMLISEAGSYFLSQDISVDSTNAVSLSAIRIESSNVTLDLDGHTILVNESGLSGVIGANATGVRVRNGLIVATVAGAAEGINLNAPNGDFTIEDVTVMGFNGIAIYVVGDCGPPSQRARVRIARSSVRGGPSQVSGDAGILLTCTEATRVENNDLRDSFTGIYLDRVNDSVVRGNVASQNVGSGIVGVNSGANSLVDNICTGNLYHGIYLVDSSNNDISNNNASKNGYDGIQINTSSQQSDFNRLTYDICSNNGGAGIAVSGAASQNTIDWNQIAGNAGYGVDLGGTTGNIFSNNRAAGNTAGAYGAGVPGANVDVMICAASTNY